MKAENLKPVRAMIVFNPVAGQAVSLERELNIVANVWRQHNWQVVLAPTSGPSDATRIAHDAAKEGYDVVVAAGGDGTINEVINGLAGSKTALATLPLGTMNVWAREIGLPLNPRMAAETLLSWQPRTIDLGQVGERYFLLMAGIGFDAEVTAGVHSAQKQRLGILAYILYGLNRFLRVRGNRSRLIIDGKRVKARVMLVVIGNSQLYGGVVKITHRATIDDGFLDVCIIKGDGILSALTHAASILLRRYSDNPSIEYYRARSITIMSRPNLPVQVDGDTITHTPVTVRIAQGALRALMPNNLPDDLVSHKQIYSEPTHKK